jgi:hypothetical protein
VFVVVVVYRFTFGKRISMMTFRVVILAAISTFREKRTMKGGGKKTMTVVLRVILVLV